MKPKIDLAKRIQEVSGRKNAIDIVKDIFTHKGYGKEFLASAKDSPYYTKLRRIMNGSQQPDLETLMDISETYNDCSIDFLLGKNDYIGNLNISKIHRIQDFDRSILRRIANDIIFLSAVAGFELSIIPEGIRKAMYEYNMNNKPHMVIEPEEADFVFYYFINPVLSGYANIITIEGVNEETKIQALNQLISGCIDDFLETVNSSRYESRLRDLKFK